MTKFSKAQKVKYTALMARLTATAEKVETTYEDFKQRQQDAWEASGADKATADYNDALAEFEDFRCDIAAAMNDYAGERSDTWQESDRGQDYEAWINAWDTEMDELDSDPPDVPSAPAVDVAKYPLRLEDA